MNTKVFIGLGNPGEKYEKSRHNAGFMFIDYLANHTSHLELTLRHSELSRRHSGLDPESSILKMRSLDLARDDSEFTFNKKVDSLEFACDINGVRHLFFKPQTYMNKSGESVQKIAQFYKLHPKDFIIIYDDLDIELGKFRIVSGYGPKVHNGLGSIQERLGNLDFTHVRIGIDSRAGDRSMSGQDYVLQNFTNEEREILAGVFERISSELKHC